MKTVQETLKVSRFSEQMLIELKHNRPKGSVLDWKDFDNMISELEYHKSKMFMAIRQNHREALKEYIADTANILLAIGNLFELYEDRSVDTGIAHELNKESLISSVKFEDSQTGQTIIKQAS